MSSRIVSTAVLCGLTLISSVVNMAAAGIRILDDSGAPFPNVLVIIKSLDRGREVGRYLTEKDGRVPPIQFDHELYRVIAMCPYGICKTTIREFFGPEASSADLTIHAPVRSTDEGGQLIGAPRVMLLIRSQSGRPLRGLQVLIRDADALREKWYRTDEHGTAEIELPEDPSVCIVLYNDAVISRRIARRCPRNLEENRTSQCIELTNAGGIITIPLD